jgi:hypothetical protein
MSKPAPALDLMANVALAGIAALLIVRPNTVARIAASPLVPKATRMTRAAARGLTLPSLSLLVLPLSKLGDMVHAAAAALAPAPKPTSHLSRLIARSAPWRRLLGDREVTRRAGRRLNDSAAVLSLSVLADSAVEHYRGSFQNRAMYVPLAVAALTLGGSLFGSADPRAARHLVRDTIYSAAAATGFVGLGFHAYNILKRPGGLSWLNLFYASPIGAPMALVLAGLLGRGAERVRDTPAGKRATVLGLPAGKMLAAVTAAGLAGTVGEAGLLHFRGAYHDPAMMLPVTVPPLASALLGAAALRPGPNTNRLARGWLRLTALLGFAGVGFHAFGIARNMGGWRNWRQNILNGPPLPAPPSFTGLALAGLAALSLIEEERHG